jgi:hypothetical protein
MCCSWTRPFGSAVLEETGRSFATGPGREPVMVFSFVMKDTMFAVVLYVQGQGSKSLSCPDRLILKDVYNAHVLNVNSVLQQRTSVTLIECGPFFFVADAFG